MTDHELYIKITQLRIKMDEFFDSEDWALYEEMEKQVDDILLELNPSNSKELI